ncbi:hypothetical protein C7B69_25280 [filamentous cyanobacterium Phorm 46]|nr:hypothetical protein C7B69_25280 [filamentous cyanobacterium Phorm 46]PSB51557.1 hypothetical protein C7B67_10340 [filamentous cyanobacterium Phorm 6]
MKDGNSDDKLVSFMKQYRPNLPEAAPDFEQKILAAIDRNDAINLNYLENLRSTASTKNSKIVGFPKWAFPAAIAASLLVFGSGYRVLVTAQHQKDEAAHLEAFLVNNWEAVLKEPPAENLLERSPTDLFNYAVTPDSEPPTN